MVTVITPLRFVSKKKYLKQNINIFRIPMGQRGVKKAREFIASIEEREKIFFLGLCGVLPEGIELYSVVLPSSVSVDGEEFVENKSVALQEIFENAQVVSGRHFSFVNMKQETKEKLNLLLKQGIVSIDLEFAFLAKEFPEIKGIMIVTDNPIYGPKFSPMTILKIKKLRIMDSIFNAIAKYSRWKSRL